jgi:hypothetical protein
MYVPAVPYASLTFFTLTICPLDHEITDGFLRGEYLLDALAGDTGILSDPCISPPLQSENQHRSGTQPSFPYHMPRINRLLVACQGLYNSGSINLAKG